MNKHDDVKNFSKKRLFDGFFKIDKYKFQFQQYDGDWSPLIEREVFERGSGAAVLLYDPDLDQVVLIEQLRVGAIDRVTSDESPWLIEVVAGIIESGFTAEETIIKETKEEAGLIIDDCAKIGEFYLSPGGSTEKIHLFYAQISAKEAKGFHGVASEHEDIRVLVMDSLEAFNAVKTGKINNAITIIALQWLQINQEKVRIHKICRI